MKSYFGYITHLPSDILLHSDSPPISVLARRARKPLAIQEPSRVLASLFGFSSLDGTLGKVRERRCEHIALREDYWELT